MADKKSFQKQITGIIWSSVKKWFPHSGDSLFLFPLFIILFIIGSKKSQFCFVTVLAGMTVTGILVWAIKQLTRKERPTGNEGKIYRKYDPFSFPSGHAARGFVIVTVFYTCNWIIALVLLFWAVAISVSRIKLQLHYMVDVIAGAIIGTGVGMLIIWLQLNFHFIK